MNRVSFIFLILCLSYTQISAQDNFVEGTIIIRQGEPLNGFIDYQNWNKNPKQIRFKEDENTPPKIFRAEQIEEFRTSGEIYIGAIVAVDNASSKSNSLPVGPQIVYRTDTVFLQVLVRGSKSLLRYKDFNSRDHFFVRENNSIQLLIHREYLRNTGGSASVLSNRTYLGQLNIYLGDCESFAIDDIRYTGRSLQKLFLDYYECKSQNPEFIKLKEKSRSEFGLWLGGTITKLSFRAQFDPQFEDANYPASVNGSAGIFIEIYIPRTLERWSFNGEIAYTAYETSSDYTDGPIRYQTEFEYEYLRFNVMARYYMDLGSKVRLFLNTGYGVGLAISERNYQLRNATEYKAIPGTRDTENGLTLGAGLNINHFLVQIRFEPNGGMSKSGGIGSKVRRFYFTVGYSF